MSDATADSVARLRAVMAAHRTGAGGYARGLAYRLETLLAATPRWRRGRRGALREVIAICQQDAAAFDAHTARAAQR